MNHFGAVGVLQFDLAMARLKTEYDVDAAYDRVDYATARWVNCENRKRLTGCRRANQRNLALDTEGI
ncbi:MAG: hypothetical protein P1P89_08240 [Desulfobacterales bacterium]|nr:hypothetical protein [Desulfobacterales bacterium]